MIMTFFDWERAAEFAQPLLATRGYQAEPPCPSSNCVTGPTTACDSHGVFPEFNDLDAAFDARFLRRPLTWNELSGEVAAGRPVAFSWCWRLPNDSRPCADEAEDDSGHMMVAAGVDWIFANVAGAKRRVPAVRVLQPLCCCQGDLGYFTYEEYREGPRHRHWRDYYCIRAAGTECAALPDAPPAVPGPPGGPAPEHGPGLELEAPDFESPRQAAEAVRDGWLAALAAAQERSLLRIPLDEAMGGPVGDPRAGLATATMLADGIPVKVVLAGELAKSPDDATLDDLMHEAGLVLFPVQAVTPFASAPWFSTIGVRQGTDGRWRPASVGGPRRARRLHEVWNDLHQKGEDTSLIEVRFLGLNVSVLAHPDPAKRLRVRPYCSGECMLGTQPVETGEALRLLREAARGHRGGPS
jgi:hypothetical protein